jgi:hypothetical protein
MKSLLLPSFLLICICAGADDKDKQPEPKLPIGKDTTYVTGPLDKQGFIDYETALNAELSKGITPEKNAAAALVLVFGPEPEGYEIPPAYFKWLDVPIPPKEGDYFIGHDTYTSDKLGLTEAQSEAMYEVQRWAMQRPWVPKDCPPLAEWLKVNEKPIAFAIEAIKRPQYFHPLVSQRKEGEPGFLIGALLPTVQKCREVATALCLRAMLRLQEKKFDAAWSDILAAHRMGRLVGRGGTFIESLVGVAICQIASSATVTYLAYADLNSKQVLEKLKELQSLPPISSTADKIDGIERFTGLDAIQMIRRGKGKDLLGILEEDREFSDDEQKAMKVLDWTPVMQTLNKWYDRIGAAMRMKDRAAREKEFDKIDEELKARKKEADPENLKKMLNDKNAGKLLGKTLGNVLVSMLSPAVRRLQQAHDRASQLERNLHVAFAMAAYQKDNSRYPAKLADLAPKYLASVPDDLFNGKPLIYKPNEKGYLFYSVGPNGKDDGGHWYDDDPPGDDPRVKMPLPEIKKAN